MFFFSFRGFRPVLWFRRSRFSDLRRLSSDLTSATWVSTRFCSRRISARGSRVCLVGVVTTKTTAVDHCWSTKVLCPTHWPCSIRPQLDTRPWGPGGPFLCGYMPLSETKPDLGRIGKDSGTDVAEDDGAVHRPPRRSMQRTVRI